MTDREFAAQQARLKRLLLRWHNPLTTMWRVTFTYIRDGGDWAKEGNTPKALACCHADWRYLHATVDWNMPIVLRMDDEELERTVVHEMMHCILNEMQFGALSGTAQDDDGRTTVTEAYMGHEERAAETLSRIILWVRDNAHLVGGKKVAKA